jgi:hypothetical protein
MRRRGAIAHWGISLLGKLPSVRVFLRDVQVLLKVKQCLIVDTLPRQPSVSHIATVPGYLQQVT